MSLSIPELCEELKPYVGRSERTDLGIIRKEAFQRFAVAADNLNPVFFDQAVGYVLADGKRVEQRTFLKDDSDLSAQGE